MKILQMPLGPLQTNCYLLGCEETNSAAIIDPSAEGFAIEATAVEQGFIISHILLTHAHFDHVGGLTHLKQATNAPIYIHPDAVPMLNETSQSARFFGIDMPPVPPADEMLRAGQTIKVGNLQLEVLYTPGHAPGHVCFYLREHNVLFDGDVLFQGSIGRTDLPGGDYDTLIKSIRDHLLPMPDDTHVLSGHGPATTIGQERRTNPFLT